MSKMSPLQLGQKLNLPPEVLNTLSRCTLPEGELPRLKAAFDLGPEAFEAEARKAEDPDLLVLALYLRWAMDTHFLYAIRGMSWDIFFDTFRDLTDSCREFYAQTGRAGLKNWAWIGYAIQMKLFRLGGLTFHASSLPTPLTMDGTHYPAGTPVLEVYLPLGCALEDEAMEEALTRGKDFFALYYRREYDLFLCHASTFRSA